MQDAEIAAYEPFGRAGSGAPVRDEGGHVVADLHKVALSPVRALACLLVV